MISVIQSGNFDKIDKFIDRNLETIAQEGVVQLASYTPTNSGLTAASWDYEIVITRDEVGITWLNRNIQNGSFSVAMGLQYGHGTGTGGWVSGSDYINPAIQPIMDKITERVWQVVVGS